MQPIDTGDYTEYSWEDWPVYTWDVCSVECGGAGTYMRLVNCIPGSDCAPECPSVSKSDEPDCDNGACQGE